MKYSVRVDRPAARAIGRLPDRVQFRILASIDALGNDPRPHGVVKLAGFENQWRIRVGDYRVIYEICDDQLLVLVVRAAHRSAAY